MTDKSREQLLEDSMQAIEKDPKHWSQWTWAIVVPEDVINDPEAYSPDLYQLDCGTACCFAGQVCLQAGGSFTIDPWGQTMLGRGEPIAIESVTWPDGSQEIIGEAAERLLDLNSNAASFLFNSQNSMAQLRVLVDALKVDPLISVRDFRELIQDIPDRDGYSRWE